ncbi:hypothetical protein KDH_38380 [Dictyobacter sp. S3.2.2.5]|uniref:Uncharacterized protein n=1 Tax=Dictyobacter halimunensis TaxID=3026934 RepID=A0ABQ6FRX1_9CHLR|nr:hypothetical protein KDH_38380 [Dictyobacter sp. S3.2.2.5]
MTNYQNFRQRLDAELRTLDVNKVRDFLISEGHWSEEAPSDPEFAMWMMIAGSQTLKELRPQAKEWLIGHGHSEEAQAVFGKETAPHKGSQKARGPKSGGSKRPAQHKSKPQNFPPRSPRQK